ncbi:uncharacterized protein LOC125944372 [Dermacentor silvarum]|uniref:uncharacterized protein LOC125944372 n=1 Tax=Dermacentor silvarum TaxID=543639 RepID=UPI002101181B|nr:uncharacterized protein LOC125944372 [Dermacentor silvarum]
MFAVLWVFAVLLGNAMAVYFPTYDLPVAGFPDVPAVPTVQAAPVAVLQAAPQVSPVTPYCPELGRCPQRGYSVWLPHNWCQLQPQSRCPPSARPLRLRPRALRPELRLRARHLRIPRCAEEVIQDQALKCDSSSSRFDQQRKRHLQDNSACGDQSSQNEINTYNKCGVLMRFALLGNFTQFRYLSNLFHIPTDVICLLALATAHLLPAAWSSREHKTLYMCPKRHAAG